MRRVLITGASGRIGSGLVRNLDSVFEPSTEIYFLMHKSPLLQIQSRCPINVVNSIGRQNYDFVLHLAANAEPKYCSKSKNHAEVRETNVGLTKKVCDVAGKVIIVSTDNVFDGNSEKDYTESDNPNPIPHNFYAVTKAEAENVVLEGKGSVIRIQTLLGVSNRVIDNVIPAITGRDYFPFWDDDFVRPSHFPDFIEVVRKVLNQGEGVYHVSCSGDALSRYEIAQEVAKTCIELGRPIKRKSFKHEPREAGARRLVLDTRQTEQELGITFTDSRKAIREHVRKQIDI